MNPKIKYHKKRFNTKNYSSFILGADIGGTQTTLAVAGVKSDQQPSLLFSISFSSPALTSLVPALNQLLTYSLDHHKIKIDKACLGAAGPVSADRKTCQLTNLGWSIDVRDILKNTPLKSVFLVNDFELIGYGLNLLNLNNKSDIFRVNTVKLRSSQSSHSLRAVVGAGTGLGKSFLVHNKMRNFYLPFPSEGGHADFPAQNQQELELINFIKKARKINEVDYESLLSGQGLENIYAFLSKTRKFSQVSQSRKIAQEINQSRNKPLLIAQYRKKDALCQETFRIFTRAFARCARNFSLDTLCFGGLFIAGGIAMKNQDIFKSREFLDEFYLSPKESALLKSIPVYVITNPHTSLLGACFAALKFI